MNGFGDDMRIWFLTFADSRMTEVHRRLRKQTAAMKVFGDRVRIYTECDLDQEFRDKMRERLVPGSRGFGYWSWKPQVIVQLLSEVRDDDVVMYVDAGCHLNPKGLKRLHYYYDLAKKYDIVAFQARARGEEARSDLSCHFWLEQEWTKMDLLRYFDADTKSDVLNTGQCEAVVIIARKCERTVRFFTQIRDMFVDHFDLCDDTPSKLPNLPSFVEHRYDQSVYSLMCKTNGVYTLSNAEYAPIRTFMPDGADENLWPEFWRDLSDCPILAKRDKGKYSRSGIKCPEWLQLILGHRGRKIALRIYNAVRKYSCILKHD